MIIQFSIMGSPVAKGRPRFSMHGGVPHTYTPQKTRDYEALIAQEARLAGCTPSEKPLKMTVEAWFLLPKSKDALRKIESNLGQCTKKPDVDNIFKIYGDALNGIAYLDDSQIYSGTCTKGYADVECVDVTLEYD